MRRGLIEAETIGMRSVEKRKVIVLYLKSLRRLTRIDGMRNEEVGNRAVIEKELRLDYISEC